MTAHRLLIKTSKGVQSLLEESIGLDERHVRVLELLDGTRQISSLAEATGYSEPDVQSILQKLTLIGYARSIAAADSAAAGAPSGSSTFGSAAPAPESTDKLDIASLRSSAKSRERGIASPINLGSAEDVWRQTHDLAQKLLSERLAREQALLQAAEAAVEQAKARDAALETARKAAEEALAQSKEEARARALAADAAVAKAKKESRARALAAAQAEALRQRAHELEQARARRLGIYRRRTRVGSALSLLFVGGLWGWWISGSVSLNASACSRLLSDWAQIESSTASCQTSLLPSPRYEARSVAVGKIDAASVDGSLAILPLFFGRAEPTSLSIHGLRLDANAISAFLRAPHKGRLGSVREVEIDGAKLLIGNLSIDNLRGSATLDPRGQLDHLALADDQRVARIALANEKGAVKFSLQARLADAAFAPIHSALDLSAYGTLDQDRLVVEDGSMNFKNGQAVFSGSVAWTSNRWRGQGRVETHSMGLADTAPWLFNGGSADLSGTFSFDGETPERAALDASVDLSGPGRNLSLKADLPEIFGAGGMGFTAFTQAALQLRYAQRRQTFTMPSLASGPFRYSVEAALSADGKVYGSVLASMPERGMSADMVLSGTPKRLELTPKKRPDKP